MPVPRTNFNETALMKQHHENYIQVKTFIKNAQKKFHDDTPTRIDQQLETTKDTQSTDVRSWLWSNPSSVDPSNENHPYLPLGRSRPTFPDEITPFTTQTNEHHLKWDEIFPNQKSKTNESSFGIDFETTAPNSTNLQLSSVSLMNSKDRKGFKPGEFEMKVNSEVSINPKREHFILKLSDPIESKLHIDNAHPSTVEPSSNLHPSSKVPIVHPEYQKRFRLNESTSRFVHPDFSLRRPMSDIQLPSKKYTSPRQNHIEVKSKTGEFKDRITTEKKSRSRNPSTPYLNTSTSSIKYQYRFNPSLQTKEFILLVKPVPVTAKSSSPSPKSLKTYPKTKNSFNPTLKAKRIILRHTSQKTTKAKVTSKTLKPSPKTLQSSGPKIKPSIAKSLKPFRPKTIKAFTKALKPSSAKNLIFTNPKILKPSLPKKTQSMDSNNCSRPPRAKPTFLPKTSLRGYSGKDFEFNRSLRRPNEEYKKIWFRDVTTYMPVENWVLTLVEKIGLTTRKSFRANPTRNLERTLIIPHALVSSKQLKNTPKNQAIHFLRQGPPRTRTMTEDHIPSTTTAESEDYSLPTMPNNIEDYGLATTTKEVEYYSLPTTLTNVRDYRLSTTATEYEDYSLPTTATKVKDHRLSTTTTEYEDYGLSTKPTNIKDHRLTTKTAEYEDYSLPTKPINIEDYKLSTTTKGVEDYSLPITSTKSEDYTQSTTATNKPRFTIENHGGILHLITVPEDDEDTARVGRPGFIVEDEEMMEPLTTVDMMYRGPEMKSTRDGMYGAQNLAGQKIDKTRRHLLKERKRRRHTHHKHKTRQRKHKQKHRKKYKKQKKQELEYPLLFTDLRKRLSIGTQMEFSKENRSRERKENGETYPLKTIPELSHNDTVIEKVFRLMETQDGTPETDNKRLYNKVKETLKQAQIRKEIERQKKKAELIRRIAEGSSYSDEEESLKRNLVQALQYGNRTSEYDLPFI